MTKRKSANRYIPKHVKEAVRRRDKDVCQICGNMSEYMEFDHITPFSKGAPSTVDNLQQLCRKCNMAKRNKTSNECSKCGQWNTHDAVYCHHCGASQPRVIRKKPRNDDAMTFGERADITFWVVRKIIGVSLILFALYYLLRLVKH
ncbi:MAG: HNH endonuclease [Acidobacteriota bacterium]|nr:HNH endonuclease [Acidobacteriota bacterium]